MKKSFVTALIVVVCIVAAWSLIIISRERVAAPSRSGTAASAASSATGTQPTPSSIATTSVSDFCNPNMSGMTDLPPLPSDFNWTPLTAANATSVVSYPLSFSSSTGELTGFDAFATDVPPFSRRISGNAWSIQGNYQDHVTIGIDYYAPVLLQQGWSRRVNFAGHEFDGMDASGYAGDDQGYIKIQNDQLRAITVDYVHSDFRPDRVIVFVSDIIPLSQIITNYQPMCPAYEASSTAATSKLSISTTGPVDLRITDDKGDKMGIDSSSSYNEISQASFKKNADGSNIAAWPMPLFVDGLYNLKITGTAAGSYALTISGYDKTGSFQTRAITASTTLGQIDNYDLYFESWSPLNITNVSHVETAATSSLDTAGSFAGQSLAYGTNTVDGVTFSVLPVATIGQTYDSHIAGTDINASPLEIWYRSKDFRFVVSCQQDRQGCMTQAYRNDDQISSLQVGQLEYGPISIKTFSNMGKTYFIFAGTYNCGTGGCNDVHILYDPNGDVPKSTKLWDNYWGWSGGYIGSTKGPYGNENGAELEAVIAYGGHLFLIPLTQPIIELDANGTTIKEISNTPTSTIPEILNQG